MTDVPANDPVGPRDPFERGICADECLLRIRENGGLATDGTIEDRNFEGWAFHGGQRAHWWKPTQLSGIMSTPVGAVVAHEFRSACSLTTCVTERYPLLGPGNFPHCARCLVQVNKRKRRK
jgi:hypothetical protein